MKRMYDLRWLLFAAVLSTAPTWAADPAPTGAYTVQQKPLVQEIVNPLRVIKEPDSIFFIDFGRDAFGQLKLSLPANAVATPGRKIIIRMGEKLSDPGHLDRKPGGSVRFFETTLTTASSKTDYYVTLGKADTRRIPPDVGAAMPFRYVELENMPEGTTEQTLKEGGIHQVAVHYVFDDAAAEFTCSDEKLNAIWQLCKYSMKATSFGSVFVDGDRERKPYEADAYINQLGWYYATTDVTLPRYTHEYLITHPTWPTEWIMFSVLTGWNDYLYTGDTTSLKAFYSDLKAKTLRGIEREDGLISTVQPQVPASVKNAIHFNGGLKDIVDWPVSERDGYEMLPVNTVVNAFHCRSLAVMAMMADALGKSDEAADFQKAAEKSLRSFNTRLVDPETGLYVDGEGSHHSSLHANMFPLAFGLAPKDRREKVVAFVKSRGMACSVYGAQFLMESLFDNGEGVRALELMKAPGDRSWRHMAEDVGTTITLEAWDTKYKPNEDWNHAWGAAPANILPRKVLGVEPLEPGYAKLLIWPRAGTGGDVTWAKGRVPTVRGRIGVEWRRQAAGFHLNVEVPPGTSTLVRLTAEWGEQIALDGKPSRGTKKDGTLLIEIPTAGKHEIVAGQ